MKIEELRQELENDLKLDVETLDIASIRIPGLHGKWLKFSMDEQAKLVGLRSRLKKLKLQKWNYYLGRGTAEEYKKKSFQLKILKSEVQQYIDADQEIRALEDQVAVKEALVDYLEGAVRAISNKQWHIKNAIEFLKFKNGLM